MAKPLRPPPLPLSGRATKKRPLFLRLPLTGGCLQLTQMIWRRGPSATAVDGAGRGQPRKRALLIAQTKNQLKKKIKTNIMHSLHINFVNQIWK